MSFEMSNIKVKRTTTKDKVVSCLKYLNDNNLLTDNLKYALRMYVNYRFKYRNCSFTANRLEELTTDLLQYCCGKSLDKITVMDVKVNECEMLYEIKKAIIYGATKCLYYVDDIQDEIQIPKLTTRQLTKKGIIKDYFGDITV